MPRPPTTTERGYGTAHQRVRKVVLARDVWCTEVDAEGRRCHRRAVHAHHDPPLAERNPPGSERYNVEKMRGLCEAHHREATGRQQSQRLKREAAAARLEEEGNLPVPAPAQPKSPSRYPKVWEGAIRVRVDGPCEVKTPSGEVFLVERGMTYWPREDGGADVLPSR